MCDYSWEKHKQEVLLILKKSFYSCQLEAIQDRCEKWVRMVFPGPPTRCRIGGAARQDQTRSADEKEESQEEGTRSPLGQDDLRSSSPHLLSTLALLPHSRPCRSGELDQSKATGAPRLAMEAVEGRVRMAKQY